MTMVPGAKPLEDAALAVKNGRIVDVGPSRELESRWHPQEVLGGDRYVVFPGLMNTHTHAAMVSFRGIADDLPLQAWLTRYIWPSEIKWVSPEFVRDAVALACMEMLQAGVTTYNDMYFYEHEAAPVVREAGMRAVLGAGVVDFPTSSGRNVDDYLANALRFIEDWHGDELISPAIAPHAPYTCAPEAYKKAKALADRFGLILNTHLCETEDEVERVTRMHGKPPVALLDDAGVLDNRFVAAHCVWITGKEMETLARTGVGVSHCVASNLKLASGIAPVADMIDKGVKVTFGTDGAASNNGLDVKAEMAMAACLQKGVRKDATVLSAHRVLDMATRLGAEVLGLGDKTGTLEKGKAADLVIADVQKPHLTPFYDIYSLIVYSLKSSDVDSVMINGKVVLRKGKCVGKDEEEILEKVRWWAQRISSG